MDGNYLLNYQEQLETPEWSSCRDRILKRDKNRCCFCGKGQSIMVFFDLFSFYLGIDFSKGEINCSSPNIIMKGDFRVLLAPLKGKSIKVGKIPGSDKLFILFSNGYLLYTPWKSIDDINEFKQSEKYLAKIMCQDGYIANVLYRNEEELNDSIFPRVYIRKEPLLLQVHHKQYLMDKKAWEYEEKDLITLCQDCHSTLHKLIPVKAYTKVNGQLIVMNYTPCHRCQGTGYFPEYRNVQNGVCFRCRGARFEELISPKMKEVEFD